MPAEQIFAATPTVAIVNHDPEVVAFVRLLLESEGYRAVDHVADGDGADGTLAFLGQQEVQVVLYSISPPYADGWRDLHAIRRLPAMRSRQFIVTTTDAAGVTGDPPAGAPFPILTLPFEIEDMLGAVRDALDRTWNTPSPTVDRRAS